MTQIKLILLNGFAGNGKSTIGKRYIKEHPLALMIEGDEIIVNLGDWLANENEARKIIFELTKSLIDTHLRLGYDVILPYLVTNKNHVNAFREIANKHDAKFYNFLLHNEKPTAIRNLLKRGTWGEAGLDPLSDKDMPAIEDLYDKMESQLEHQADAIILKIDGHTIEETFSELMAKLVG